MKEEKTEKVNIHEGHRKRLKRKLLNFDSENFEPHEALEILLFYSLPRQNTNPIAHELIDSFGSLQGVIDAPVEELQKIKGVGENAATLIKLMHDLAVLYGERTIVQDNSIPADEKITNYLAMKYAGQTKEVVYMLCVNSMGNILNCIKVCDGSPDSAVLTTRMVVETAVSFDSKDIIIAHNHPNGFAVPSMADVTATQEFISVLESIGINLADHIIVSKDDQFSMAKSRKYSHLFKD